MLKKVLAVCDEEEAYVSAFLDFLREQKTAGFSYIGFHKTEDVMDYASLEPPILLLISEDMLTEDIKGLGIKIIRLVGSKEEVDETSVYKYQKASDLVAEISQKSDATFIKKRGGNLLFGSSRLVGVYSPVRRTGKSTFSVSLSGILARKYRVLYLNLESSCGFEWAFSQEDAGDLSDIIYDIRQEKPDLKDRLALMIKNNGYFDFLPPAPAAEDVRAVGYDQLLKLFELISEMNKYRFIVIDFDELLHEYLSVISDCDRLFMPLLDDDISIAKLRNFLRILDSRCAGFDREKIIPLALPKAEEDMVGISGIDRLLWSDFGVYVKEVIQEVGL